MFGSTESHTTRWWLVFHQIKAMPGQRSLHSALITRLRAHRPMDAAQ
jgi:hypothetical protein